MEENKTDIIENKTKIIPNYNKKVETHNKPKKIKSKITKVLICIIILIILSVSIILIINLFLNKYKQYSQYSDKMNIYGFGQLYDNEKTTEYQRVTKSEAIKLIVSATINMSNIDKLVYIENLDYENQEWVEYAIENEIISNNEINKDNYNDKATLMDCLKYMYNSKVKILNLNTDIEANPKFSDFDKYSNEDKIIIRDMVWNKIIEDKSENLNADKKVSKGELNKLIVLYSEKYNTITENDEKIVINDEKLPKNYLDYAYCVSNVNKQTYETRYLYSDVTKFKKPSEIYSEFKENFYSLGVRVQEYMLTILNIDYNTIKIDDFKRALNDSLLYPVPDKTIEEYINYVKSNHIIVKGQCKVVYPAFYFDGNNYRIRCTVSYSIENADNKNNIFFGDSLKYNNTYNYDENDRQVIVDLPVNKRDNENSLYVYLQSINDCIVSNTNK